VTHERGPCHFTFGSAAKADARLRPDATQLVVAEAKIHSPLSGGTRNAPTFDQAARNVACITELLTRAGRRPNEMRTLAFYVVAPRRHIEEGGIPSKLQKTSIEQAVISAQAFAQGARRGSKSGSIPHCRRSRLSPFPGSSSFKTSNPVTIPLPKTYTSSTRDVSSTTVSRSDLCPPNNSMEPTRPGVANWRVKRVQELAGRLISRPLGATHGACT
jgi:hypothetical protein